MKKPIFRSRSILIYTFLLFCIVSCRPNYKAKWEAYNQKYQDYIKYVNLSDFQGSEPVEFEKTGLNFANGIIDLEIIDSTLLLSSRVDTMNLILTNINNFDREQKIIKRGKQRNQCLNVSDIIPGVKKNHFFAFDITLRKLLEFDLNEIHRGNLEPERIVELSNEETKGIKSPAELPDGSFVATSYFADECRYLRFTTGDSVSKKIGELPPESEGWPEATFENKIRPMSYSANLKKQVGSDNIAVAYTTTSRIEIYSNDKIKTIIIGPGNFDPIYKFKKGPNPRPLQTKTTKFSHVKIKTDSQNLYTLYSGEADFASCAQKLLIFSFKDGSPKRVINLGMTVCNFAIKPLSNNKALLFVINKDTGELLKTEIQI